MKTFSPHIMMASMTLALFAGSLVFLPSLATAQTAKPSTDSAELQKNLRQLLDQTLEKNDNENQFIGTLGTIDQVTSNTFQITDTLGRNRTIDVEPDATILVEGKAAKLADVSIGAGVVVMGSPVDEVVMSARRVLVQAKPFTETREVILGTITGVERTQITVTARQSSETYVFTTNTQSAYEDILGTKIARTVLEEDQAAILVASRGENGTLTLEKLRLLVPIEASEE